MLEEGDLFPSLLWDAINEIPDYCLTKPLPKFETDTKLIVWDELTTKLKRYYSHFRPDGTVCVYDDGKTSWNGLGVTAYKYYEEAK